MTDSKKGIAYVPDFTELSEALNAYYSTDKELIEDNISALYSSLSGQIPMLPLRFFHRFINEKASLFSNSFERQLKFRAEGIEFDQDELTLAEMYTERYHHLFQASATQVNFDGEKVSFIALDATMYFHDVPNDVWYLRVTNNKTYVYIKQDFKYTAQGDLVSYDTNLTPEQMGENLDRSVALNTTFNSDDATQNQGMEYDTNYNDYIGNTTNALLNKKVTKVIVYETVKPTTMENLLDSMDYSKTMEENGLVVAEDTAPLDGFPFVEWRSHRIKRAIPHELAKLQRDYITMLSWGFFNVSPKLLNQIIVKSGMNNEKLKEVLSNLGSSTSALKLELLDEIEVFDTGDITVLKDLFAIYSTILEQAALHEGVDKNAIVAQMRIESGEAKKVELGYINKARNNFKVPARLYEREIVNILKNVYKLDIEYNGIVFHDLALASDPVSDLEYATAMYVNHFWTYPQSYAYVNKVTVEVAETLIEELGLTPPINMEEQGLRTQVEDTALKNGFQTTPAGEKAPKVVSNVDEGA